MKRIRNVQTSLETYVDVICLIDSVPPTYAVYRPSFAQYCSNCSDNGEVVSAYNFCFPFECECVDFPIDWCLIFHQNTAICTECHAKCHHISLAVNRRLSDPIRCAKIVTSKQQQTNKIRNQHFRLSFSPFASH